MEKLSSALRRHVFASLRAMALFAAVIVAVLAGADAYPVAAESDRSFETAPAAAVQESPESAAPPVYGPLTPERTAVDELLEKAPGLHREALSLALTAAESAAREGLVTRPDLLTVIDYSLPSTEPRLFVFDLEHRDLLFRELVAHGKNSGGNLTTRFSNRRDSLATSLGLFVTARPYYGGNGYSLRLRGLDEGFNDQAWSRAIVLHGASYVSEATARALGRIGRSWGCPAVPAGVSKKIIDTLKGGSPVFAYYPDEEWLKSSRFLKG